ncbi:unnamed protein product, partial [marine sediment metagenome]
MALVTVTVAAGDGDYYTLDEAFDNALTGDDIEIQGAWDVDDTRVAICAVDCQVTATGTARHAGVYDTTAEHYRLVNSTSSNAITLNGAYTVTIDGLVVEQAGASESTEGLRCGVTDGDSCTITNTIFHGGAGTGTKQDGIHATDSGGAFGELTVENCIFTGWQRAGIYSYAASTAGTININSCMFAGLHRERNSGNDIRG